MALWITLLSLLVFIIVPSNIISSVQTKPTIIAHRGASYDAPENTLASINLGWKQGADAVEIDVYMTKDKKIAVIHDKSTKRTGALDKLVKDQTLSELKTLDVGAFKNPKWKGEKIPSLEEALATVPNGKILVIEIKCGKEILSELKRVLNKCKTPDDQALIICFDLETIKAAKKDFPKRKAYWLVGFKQDEKDKLWKPCVDELIKKAKKAGVDGLNVNSCDYVNRDFVDKVKAAGLECYVWTVNDKDSAMMLERIGVDGITTDKPGFLVKILSTKGKEIK